MVQEAKAALALELIESEGQAGRSADVPARIAERIRERIVRGAISPGVHMGQMQLAEEFGASRVPVREALKLLAAEGILSHDPNRGFFVASLSASEASQLYRVRRLLEAELLKSVDWPGPTQLKRLNTLARDMDRCLREGRRADWAAKHRDFHSAIFELSPQKVLAREVFRLWGLTDRYRSILPTPDAAGGAEDERHLLDALAKRDRKALLGSFERDRARVEKLLLGLLEARGL